MLHLFCFFHPELFYFILQYVCAKQRKLYVQRAQVLWSIQSIFQIEEIEVKNISLLPNPWSQRRHAATFRAGRGFRKTTICKSTRQVCNEILSNTKVSNVSRNSDQWEISFGHSSRYGFNDTAWHNHSDPKSQFENILSFSNCFYYRGVCPKFATTQFKIIVSQYLFIFLTSTMTNK